MSPKAIALTVAGSVLGAAYLDAKYFISHDLYSLYSVTKGRRTGARAAASDTINAFNRFIQQVSLSPSRDFLVYGHERYSYSESLDLISRWASYLRTMGVQKGDTVALMFTNKPGFIWSWFACWSIGAIPAFINFNLVGDSLWHCISISRAKIIVFDAEVSDNVNTIQQHCNKRSDLVVICYDDAHETIDHPGHLQERHWWDHAISPHHILKYPNKRPPPDLSAGAGLLDSAILIYTSGSTGLPKAAIIPWHKFTIGAVAAASLFKLVASDRFYTCMPIYHATATLLGVGVVLATGCTLILGHKFSPATFWKEVYAGQATAIQYVGESCRYLLNSPVDPLERKHHVRFAIGNGMRSDIWATFRDRFNIPTILEFYGATEGLYASFNYNSNDLGVGAVGKQGPLLSLIAGTTSGIFQINRETEALIRDQRTGFCIQCKEGEQGELLQQLDPSNPAGNFAGYAHSPSATSSKLISGVLKRGDTWFRSGDLLSVRGGFTFFHDRLGDSFRWKGENVSTLEVAEYVSRWEGVKEANVYGVLVPGYEGRVGCAAIDCDEKMDGVEWLRGLGKYLEEKLPSYAVPRFLRLAKNMERTGNYKQQKTKLREQGVQHDKVNEDILLWLRDGDYVAFTRADWNRILGGKAKL